MQVNCRTDSAPQTKSKEKKKSKKTQSKTNPKLMQNSREVKAILKYAVDAFSYQVNPLRINSYSNCSFKG